MRGSRCNRSGIGIGVLGWLILTGSASHGGDDPKSARPLIKIGGKVERPRQWTASDLAQLPRRVVRTKDHQGHDATFEGVALGELLKQAGVAFGTDLRGEKLQSYLIVDAADGYRAVFAVPELDPAFTDRVVLLADRRDGQPLVAAEGPLRIVIPDEKRHARWVRQVTALTIEHAPSGSATVTLKNVATAYDIIYAKVGAAELKLDLARPEQGKGPFPAVVIIHGGAWRAGKKEDLRGTLDEFARQGYVAISPEYRLCPQETFPAQVHDVKAAVRWLRAHAQQYHVDPDHVGALGFSAGGHLALMLGVTGPDDGLEGERSEGSPSSRVQAVVNYFGPTDLAAADIPAVSRNLVRDFLGGTPKDKPEAAAKASPLTFVTEDDAPVLTFQGTKDPLVPHTQATKLGDALAKAGVPGRVELILGAGHGWRGDDLKRTRRETFEFLDAYLKPKPKAVPAQTSP